MKNLWESMNRVEVLFNKTGDLKATAILIKYSVTYLFKAVFSEIFQTSYFNPLSLTSQNGHIYFKNLAANSARFLKCDHFGALCIKGLRTTLSKILWPLFTDRGSLSRNFETTARRQLNFNHQFLRNYWHPGWLLFCKNPGGYFYNLSKLNNVYSLA